MLAISFMSSAAFEQSRANFDVSARLQLKATFEWGVSRFDTSFQQRSVKDTKNCQGEGFSR